MEWLKRSAVGEIDAPSDLEVLLAALVKDGVSKIYALSIFKFILTFPSIVKMEEALVNRELLSKWFKQVKRWDVYECCGTRKARIEVFGVPQHGWMTQNFESRAFLWSKLVCLETPIEDTVSFESMKFLIDADRFHSIDGQVVLQIRDAGFLFMIKEASCTFQINPQFVIPANSSSTEVKDPKEAIQKLEVQGDDVDPTNEVAINHLPHAGRMVGASSEGADRRSPRVELEGNAVQHPSSINSNTKTKSVQFSQNGYSEEVIKISQRCTSSQNMVMNGHIDPQPL